MAANSSEGVRKEGGGIDLYFRECCECLEFKDSYNRVECLQVRIRGKDKTDIMVGVSYKLLNQDEEADKMFYGPLGEASRSLALVQVGISI